MIARALAVALAVAAPAAAAAAPCTIGAIKGTYQVQVTSTWQWPHAYERLPITISTTCWFMINPPGNLGIQCEEEPFTGADFFGQFRGDLKPWHQLTGPTRDGSAMVGPPRAGPWLKRRIPTPNRCEWRITDRKGVDGEYQVWFAPNRQALTGAGGGIVDDPADGSQTAYRVTFHGVRQ